MARRPVGRTLVRAPKRGMFWEGADVADQVASAAVVFSTVVTEANLESVPNPTLIRVRGSVLVTVSAIGAAGAVGLLSLGLIKQSSRAIAAGVGSMPVPFGQIESDWLWHTMVPLVVRVAITETDDPAQVHRLEIDNKAMRKFEPNEALVLIGQNTVVSGTMTIDYCAAMRFLFKK